MSRGRGLSLPGSLQRPVDGNLMSAAEIGGWVECIPCVRGRDCRTVFLTVRFVQNPDSGNPAEQKVNKYVQAGPGYCSEEKCHRREQMCMRDVLTYYPQEKTGTTTRKTLKKAHLAHEMCRETHTVFFGDALVSKIGTSFCKVKGPCSCKVVMRSCCFIFLLIVIT